MKANKILLILLITNLLLTSCQDNKLSILNEDTLKIDTETTRQEEVNAEKEGNSVVAKDYVDTNHGIDNQETINNIELETEKETKNDIIGWAYDIKITNTEQINNEVYKIDNTYFSIEIYEYTYTKNNIDLTDKKVCDKPVLGDITNILENHLVPNVDLKYNYSKIEKDNHCIYVYDFNDEILYNEPLILSVSKELKTAINILNDKYVIYDSEMLSYDNYYKMLSYLKYNYKMFTEISSDEIKERVIDRIKFTNKNNLSDIEKYNIRLLEFLTSDIRFETLKYTNNNYDVYKFNEEVFSDLNNDAKEDKILIEYVDNTIKININDELLYTKECFYNHNKGFFIIDIDKTDDYKEILLNTSAKVVFFTNDVFYYDGEEVFYSGQIKGYPMNNIKVDGNGLIKSLVYNTFYLYIEAEDEYKLNNNHELVKIDKSYYEVYKKFFITNDVEITANKKDGEVYIIPEATVVTVKGIDTDGYLYIETDESISGWFEVKDRDDLYNIFAGYVTFI